jgi:Bacterial extracellular solute-binding protein
MADYTTEQQRPRVTWLGKLVVFLFVAACGYGAYRLFAQSRFASLVPGADRTTSPGASASSTPNGQGLEQSGSPRSDDGVTAEIGIAYGTEKKNWLEWAAREFAKSGQGQIKLNLIPMGSLEGAQALVGGDKRINVWTPASGLYKDIFVQDWQIKHSRPPILKEESLALTPMVFVIWSERFEAFKAKYAELGFDSIRKALAEPTGWDAIAKQPDWGLFKFGHTLPNESNSGLMTLVLMAYEHHKKSKNLTLADVVDAQFQTKLSGIERAVSPSTSTGTLMREMVLKGPSTFDAVFVYESVAIDYLKSAQGRWGEIRVVYPRLNMWSDNPYYIIDADWSTSEQKRAAEVFLEFLMSEPVQRVALEHGFRPGNPSVPVMFPESPFAQYQRYGLKNEITQIAAYPQPEVINNLLAAWQRSH